MSFSFIWDSAFESYPPNTVARDSIDNEIRRIALGIRERMSREHEWGPGTLDDGTHKQGYVTAVLSGSTAQMNDLASPANTLFWNTSTDTLYAYSSGQGWYALAIKDHATLVNRTEDDHPQYILRGGDVLTGDLDMDGNVLTVSEGSGVVPYSHVADGHSPIDSVLAIKDGAVLQSNFAVTVTSYATTLEYNTRYAIPMSGASAFAFLPNFYASEDDVLILAGTVLGGTYGVTLINRNSGEASATVRVNFKEID